MKIKQALRKIFLILGFFGLLSLLAFSNYERGNRKLNKVEVELNYSTGDPFLDQQQVENLINETNPDLLKQHLSEIRADRMEDLLLRQIYIEDAQVSMDIDGSLHVKVSPRKAIARLIDTTGFSCYMDREGMIIPWTSSYSPHVPVFMLGQALESKDVMGKNYKSTDINDSVLKIQPLYGVHRLASYIDSSEFWKAQVDQVYLGENLEFIPRAGGHTVVLGDFSSLDEKLNKLLIFYREGLNKVGWNKYSVINLSYKGQVVASRTGAIVRRQELKAEPLSSSEPPVNRAERIDSVDVSKAASGDSRKEEERPKESKRREKIAEEKKPKKNSVKSSEAGKEKKSAKKEAAKSGKSDKDKSGKTKKKQGNPD